LIYVRRDPALIPEKLLKVAERAQAELEELPPEDRIAFIKKKSHIWRAFNRILSRMSYGKCWYSESLDAQSFYDVDHFRPKSEAGRAPDVVDDGYPWLAFSWENFRYAAQRCNRHSKDEDTGLVAGKGNWFPLMSGSPRATWQDRCEFSERPALLDPTNRNDVDLISVNSTGHVCPSVICIGSARLRVAESIGKYGLNLPNMVSARQRVMRDITDIHSTLMTLIGTGELHPDVADALPVDLQREQLRRKTFSDSAYSKAARARLVELGLGLLCAQPEDVPPLD
jgi:hypothetical protein